MPLDIAGRPTSGRCLLLLLSAAALMACANGHAQSQPQSASANAAAPMWIHVVEPGDTLIGLRDELLQLGTNWRLIQRLNRVANPNRLRPGSELRIPVGLLRAEPVDAEVLHTHGDAWLERAGSARQPLAAAAVLRAGDVVGTGEQSSLSLRFADGSRTQLGPKGRLRLDSHMRLGAGRSVRTQLQLDAGGTETEVPPQTPAPRFELRTPAVNLGVRGTEFRARVDEQRTWVEVERGRVAAGPRLVDAGFGAAATPQGTAPPQRLAAAPDIGPLPERVERLPLQLAWAAGPGSGAGPFRYRAQVLDLASNPPRLVLEALVDQPQVQWNEELPDGRYELRVRQADSQGIEGRGASHSFTLDTQPVPPFQLRPRAGESLDADSTALAWARTPQAARYRLQVAATPDFANPVLARDDVTDTELAATLPLGTWFWRLASVRADGDTGPWGDARRFDRVPPPPPPPAPTSNAPVAAEGGVVVSWSASGVPGASYQVQISRDPAFTDLVVDERVTRTEQLLAQPAPGAYHVRVRTIGPEGREGGFGAAQIVDVPRSNWWLWLLPLLLLL